MKSLKYLVLCLPLFAACGGNGPDQNADSGMEFRIAGITPGSDSVNTICTGNGRTLMQADSSTVVLENKKINENVVGTDVIVKSYTINYAPLDGGPALTGHNYPIENQVVVPNGGSVSSTVWMFPIATKTEYQNATTNTAMYANPKLYRVDYDFVGVTSYGDDVEAQGSTTVQLGNTFVVTCK